MPKHLPPARLQRVKKLIAKLDAGVDVQARDLLSAMGEELYREFEQTWTEQQQLKAKGKPDLLAQYERLLKKAVMAHGRLDALSSKPESARASLTALRRQCDRDFHAAREALEEAIAADPSVLAWLDRRVDLAPDGDISLDPTGMPRVVTSKSARNLSGFANQFGVLTKRQMKREFLVRAEQQLNTICGSDSAAVVDSLALKEKLAKLKKQTPD